MKVIVESKVKTLTHFFQFKIGCPFIRTDFGLEEYQTIFIPTYIVHPKRRSHRARKAAPKELLNQRSSGFLGLELPSEDEEDKDWRDASDADSGDALSGSESETDSDDLEDSEYDSDEEEDCKEILKDISSVGQKNKADVESEKKQDVGSTAANIN